MKLRIALATLAMAVATTAAAQGYPNKPIRLVVPFAAGGNVDITARQVAPGMSELLGRPVLVENRVGASGIIAAELVAKSPPDGYTLMMGSNSTVSIVPSLYPKLPYHPLRDFAPVSLVATTPFVLVVHPSVPAKTVAELIALAKAEPGKLTMASGGPGSAGDRGEQATAPRDVGRTAAWRHGGSNSWHVWHWPVRVPASAGVIGGRNSPRPAPSPCGRKPCEDRTANGTCANV